MPKKDPSNAELLEFIKENVATKQDLAPLETRLTHLERIVATKTDLERFATKQDLKGVERRLVHQLGGIAKQLSDGKAEAAANQAAHRRFDHRDHVFAVKLQVNLDQVDAEA